MFSIAILKVEFFLYNFQYLGNFNIDEGILLWKNNKDSYFTHDIDRLIGHQALEGIEYEILGNGNHYLLLGNEDWMSEEEEVIKTIKKELYDWASEELTNFGE